MTALRAVAPAKVNLCLYLGQTRQDGLHELVSLVQAVNLLDDVTLEPAPPGASDDEVVCPGVGGRNLAADALAAYRQASGWDAPPQRITIEKRVPVAGGMGGGSSDAAATLRLAARAAGRPDDPLLDELAPALGADVKALLRPGAALVTGAGERVRRLPNLEGLRVLVLPLGERLSTPDVYREADRLGLCRSPDALDARRAELDGALAAGDRLPAELWHNDLEPAARSLCPAIDGALETARAQGAQAAMVSGSGPTVVGIFTEPAPDSDRERPALLDALDGVQRRFPGACVVAPLSCGADQPARAPVTLPGEPA